MSIKYVTLEGTYSLDPQQIEALWALQLGPVRLDAAAGFMGGRDFAGDIDLNELFAAGLVRIYFPPDGSEPHEVMISDNGRLLLWEMAESEAARG